MRKKITGLLLTLLTIFSISKAQDTSTYKVRLSVPIADLPQNINSPQHLPSMDQALEFSNDLYELSFWGIDALGDKLFISDTKPYTLGREISNSVFKYGLSLAFSKYGSELPIPLGVWGHEEYHRSVLAIVDVSSENGNWLLSRWDGTVYGISDSTLSVLKTDDIDQLLYSYVAGIQYEIALNEKTSINDFYKKRSLAKNALLLYNAYYVYEYFNFSASDISDSVKVLAPPHESANPVERDYAGADLTAWIYDMFNPNDPYSTRDSFPDGDGLNRRIGFSDLSPEAQSYLESQKKLSLINFINPAIFFVNRIRLNDNLAFNFFAQYAPTHFGNDIAFFLPLQYKKYDLLLNVHNYNNYKSSGYGIGVGLYNFKFTETLESDFTLNFWDQPKSFYGEDNIFGGSMAINTKYNFGQKFGAFVSVSGKTEGWTLSNPYLDSNVSVQAGINYNLAK